MDEYRTGTAYLQVVSSGYRNDLKVAKVTQRRPVLLEPGAVVVKVLVRVPRSAFQPLEAEVTVPESAVLPVEIRAEESPTDQGEDDEPAPYVTYGAV